MKDRERDPVFLGDQTLVSVTEKVVSIPLKQRHPRSWIYGFAISFSLLLALVYAVLWLFVWGVGVWGIQIPVAWGFAIVNFVWWIGIGHAGTLISAILLLLHQRWRTSINRFAEAMTLFAIACAGMFPLLHLGRPRFFYWLFPYPATMGVWPQFRSPLVWDFFAVSTYGIVSLIFWYIGLVPDLATARDRARGKVARVLYGIFAMGWRGSVKHWKRYEMTYLVLAGLATPLVVSVHSVVSFDFAVAIVPGWHSTIFPPYFVAGAIFSGFAMVLVLVIPIRKFYGLGDLITARHLEVMAKLTLVTGWVVTYGYIVETFNAYYSGSVYERSMMVNRVLGPYGWVYWLTLFCNAVAPNVFWSRRMRRSVPVLFVVGLIVLLGMWTERFVIVIGSLSRDFMPSAWGEFVPTFWDWATLLGSVGLFLSLMFLFVRFVPMISMSEMRELVSPNQEAV